MKRCAVGACGNRAGRAGTVYTDLRVVALGCAVAKGCPVCAASPLGVVGEVWVGCCIALLCGLLYWAALCHAALNRVVLCCVPEWGVPHCLVGHWSDLWQAGLGWAILSRRELIIWVWPGPVWACLAVHRPRAFGNTAAQPRPTVVQPRGFHGKLRCAGCQLTTA